MAKTCRKTGKIGYRSVGEARAASEGARATQSMARSYERAKRETGAYKCPHCPRWHLTSVIQTDSSGVNF